ncbi:MAG: aldo/keto reductase, partial [Anaerolineae bacterium]|nr:aldo/keto reductase [Anaerolineae bacterium]
ARAADAGLGVIVKEALANGRLTSQNHQPADADRMAVLTEVAHQLKATIDQVALAAVLAQPWVAIALSGAARLEHLESNVRALTLNLDEEALSRLLGLAEPAETYWQTRSNLPWN